MVWTDRFVREQVKNELIFTTTGPQLWILPYYTKKSGDANEVTEFIWKFKDGGVAAVALATELLTAGISKHEKALRDKYGCSVICASPSSQQGGPSIATDRVCEELAKRFPWLTHRKGLLQRIQTIKRAHLCAPGERPTVQTHLDTVAASMSDNLKGRGVLLFDDVVTRGGTSEACSQILKSCMKCGPVVGLFLGKTQ